MATVVLTLALLEGGLRLVLGNFAQSLILERSDDPDVCLELRPGADVGSTGWLLRVATTRMRVNALGARGPEVPAKSPRLRIAAFGDSFTFGQGVQEDESWPAVVKEGLLERGVDAEVLNFGVPGHGTPQAAALARRMAAQVEADVVLLAVFTNDLSPQDSYCGYGDGDSRVERWALQNLYLGRLGWILTSPLRGAAAVPEGAASPEVRFQEAVAGLEAEGQRAGFLTGVVLLTARQTYAAQPWCDECTPPHDLLPERGGPHALDMSATWLVLEDHREQYFLRGDEHLTAAGNRVMGEAVTDALWDWPNFRARNGP